MNADVCAGNPTTQDYLVLSAQQTPNPHKRERLAIVKTIMRIMQDIDFADQYLEVVEEVAGVDGAGEGSEESEEQKWMKRKKRIKIFQEEVWEAFLEGRVENPFKKLDEKGDGIRGCKELMPTKASNVSDPGVIEGTNPGVPFLPVRDDASGGAEGYVGSAAVSGGVAAPVLVNSTEPVVCKDRSRFDTDANSPWHRSLPTPPPQSLLAKTSYHMAQTLLVMSHRI